MTDDNGYMLIFIPIQNADAITIFVRYMANVDREAMNIDIDSARKVIEIKTKSHGWDGWVKIQEKIEMAKPTR